MYTYYRARYDHLEIGVIVLPAETEPASCGCRVNRIIDRSRQHLPGIRAAKLAFSWNGIWREQDRVKRSNQSARFEGSGGSSTEDGDTGPATGRVQYA
jgi:hypothetical protein